MHKIEELWIDYELACRSCNYVKEWNYAIEMAEINKLDLLNELREIYDLCKIEDYEGQELQVRQITDLLIDACKVRLRKGLPLVAIGRRKIMNTVPEVADGPIIVNKEDLKNG